MGKRIDLTGQRFGRLVAVKFTGLDKNHKGRWDCLCDCGRTVNVETHALRCGNTTSCGCSRKGINAIHGKSGSRLHGIWGNMIQRTSNPNNPNYADYGGRGISVCDEWLTFETFYLWAIQNGYAEGLTIDRTDNDKGYSPENCRWVTRKAQSYNRRSNHLLEYEGEFKTIEEWATYAGIGRGTLETRLKLGWSIEKALETPVKEVAKRTVLEYRGETRTIGDWAAYTGIKRGTLALRLKLGWSIEKALETPVKKKTKHK